MSLQDSSGNRRFRSAAKTESFLLFLHWKKRIHPAQAAACCVSLFLSVEDFSCIQRSISSAIFLD